MSRAARAFADAVDEALIADEELDVPEEAAADSSSGEVPVKGSPESMYVVLNEFASVNDREHRGVSREEARQIAKMAGMDPRGTAGYYSMIPPLLATKGDGRWITDAGRERLRRLGRFGPK
ncbi:hypothetical protein [Modestobacter sp. SYSU DS0511]